MTNGQVQKITQMEGFKFSLVLFLLACIVGISCVSCTPKTKPSWVMGMRSRERGYKDKVLDNEVAHIYAMLQYEPNRANEIIEDHLTKANREWPFYALLGHVLIEANRIDYAESVLKLAYAKLIKRIPSAEIHDPNGILPVETGLDFQANHDPRELLVEVYFAKLLTIKGYGPKEEAERERLFKEAIYFNPRNNALWKSYSLYLDNRNRKEEAREAIGHLHCTVFSLDRGTEVRITGVKTPWSAADQYDYKAGRRLRV